MYVSNVPTPDRPVLAEFKTHNDAFAWMGSRELKRETWREFWRYLFGMAAVVVCAWLVLGVAEAKAAETTLNWQAPTQNVDGTPLTDLDGYLVYFGPASRNYRGNVSIDDPTATSATVSFAADWLQLGDNEIFISMTALDSRGNESAYSNEIRRTVTVIDDVAPGAPIIITVTIEIGIDCPAGVTCTVVAP